MKIKLCFALLVTVLSTFTSNAQDLAIYDLHLYESAANKKLFFTSLSDIYPLSEHPDSLAIPDVNRTTIKNIEYFKLDQKYRDRFLYKTKISETDIVYIYDYTTDILVSFPVKQLDLVARLSPYSSPEETLSQFDYMIGFEISETALKKSGDNYSSALVYVGKKNPFARGGMKPVSWKKIDAKDFPLITPMPENDSIIRRYSNPKYIKGPYYAFEANGLKYFVHDTIDDDMIAARLLRIMDLRTGKMVCERLFYQSEGSSVAPLNSETGTENYFNQWAGKLFNDKPLLLLGMEYVTFGCPFITVIGTSEKDIGINCDNRH